MNAPLPTFAFLDVLSPSLRRANLEACARLIAADIEYWSAEAVVWKQRLDSSDESIAWMATDELPNARQERRNAVARRRRLWALATLFNVNLGQPCKTRTISPKLVQLIKSARERYGADQVEAA